MVPIPSPIRRRVLSFLMAGVCIVSLGLPCVFSQGGPTAPVPAAPAAPEPALSAPAGGAGGVDFTADREAIFNAFYRTGLDTSKAYSVTNLSIKKDTMTLLLKQGTVFLMQPVGGEITGAAFIGDGEASMTPPNRTERYMMKKSYGAEVLKEPFTEAVFRFSDGSEKSLVANATPDPEGGARVGRANAMFRDRNAWLDGSREIGLEMQFLESRISHLSGQDFFVTEFNTKTHDWVGYIYNPVETVENLLYTRETMGAKDTRYRVIWSDWHKSVDYDAGGHYRGLPEKDGPQALRIRSNDMDLNMKTTKTVEWEARMQIEPQVTNLHALRFDVANNAHYLSHWDDTSFYPIRMTGVADSDGKPLPFMHKKDQLLVLLPQPTRAGAPMLLVFRGSADVIYQVTAESFGRLQDAWYPQYGYLGGRASFHWTVRVPQPFLITGSGKVVREFVENGNNQNGIEIRCDEPIAFPWVIFGRFKKADTVFASQEGNRRIGMTLHSFPQMSFPITDKETLEAIGSPAPVSIELSAPLKRVSGFLDEGKEILKLFEKIYGPYPYEELHIAQMAPFMGFGQAPQGFVQLTGEAFMSPTGGVRVGHEGALLTYDFGDFIHGFLSHEIAHQWWGHQVGWASSDDQWLSESFAEYAAGLFVKEYQGAKRFQQTLTNWRQKAKLGDLEAPIAAANTLRGPNAFRSREQLLYNKGPYVLHMLRVQLDDENYVKVMRSILKTYENQNVSTEMVLREINRVTGSDYTYFFDQWFWDVGIPKFRYSWRSEKQPDGKFLITVHISQEDKNHLKRVLMPIHIHFKDKTIPQYKPVTQMDQDIKLLSPAEPKDVTLDDDHSLLADIVKAG